MSKWNDIRNYIEQRDQELESASWNSQKKGLMEIFDVAEKYEIEPPDVSEFQFSQYREIIKEAKEAIDIDDRSTFEKLLNLANTMTVKKLRIELEKKRRQDIFYYVKGEKYVVEYTIKQFRRVVKSTEVFFKYHDINQKMEKKNGTTL